MKLITGAPGSGKTHRLASEIRRRLAGGTSPYMILATTFSRQAAREIAQRVGGDVSVRTIHGMAYWLIRLARQARGEKVPQVLSSEEALALMRRAAKEVGVRFVEPRQAWQDMERIRARGGGYAALHPQEQRIIERYFRILKAENRIDFTGLLETCSRELEDPELRRFLKGIHVFVDEGQDINPITEWPILDALRRGASEFVVLASPSQSIYGFRGADWGRLAACFPEDIETEVMQENRRSTPEIVDAARVLAGPDASGMQPLRPSLGIPVLAMDAPNPEMEVDCVARTITQWIERFRREGAPMHEIAVLTRTHAQQHPLQIALRLRGIPYRIVGSEQDLFTREETQAVLAYLRLALDPMDDGVLESILNFPPCGIGIRTRYLLRRDEVMTWDHLIQALAQPDAYREQVMARLHRILDLREIFADLRRRALSTEALISSVIRWSEIPSYLNSEGDFASSKAIQDLLAAGVEFADLERFVDYLAEQLDQPRQAEGVQLSTLHASKGREWKGILIPGFQAGLLPLDEADPQEERNLAFVGMTRAKDHLVLTMSRSQPVSPLLGGVPLTQVRCP